MIFDLDDIQKKKEVNVSKGNGINSTTSPLSGHAPSNTPDQKPSGIIRKVVFTRVEFDIYPGGRIYPGNVKSWVENQEYHSRKKVKKVVKTKKVAMKEKEEY